MCAPKNTAPAKQKIKPTWISSRKACSLTTSITGKSLFSSSFVILHSKHNLWALDDQHFIFPYLALYCLCRIVDNMPVTWCYDVEDNQKFCNPGFPIGCYVTETGLAKDACVVNVSVLGVFTGGHRIDSKDIWPQSLVDFDQWERNSSGLQSMCCLFILFLPPYAGGVQWERHLLHLQPCGHHHLLPQRGERGPWFQTGRCQDGAKEVPGLFIVYRLNLTLAMNYF